MGYVPRLIERYKKVVVPHMMKKFNYKNPMQVPRLEKIVINMGVGEATENPKFLESAVEDLRVISGQQPVQGQEGDLQLPPAGRHAHRLQGHSAALADVRVSGSVDHDRDPAYP